MIVDANVLLSALFGRSLPLLIEMREKGVDLLMPSHQLAECRVVALRKRGMPTDDFNLVAPGVIDEIPISTYARREEDARRRLSERGQPDWPVLAAALETADSIWSNDRDFFGVGVAVWTTHNVGWAVPASTGR